MSSRATATAHARARALFKNATMRARLTFVSVWLLALCCAVTAHAQDHAPFARELITLKGSYTEKKKQFEEVRIRAYVPILLKAVGKGPAWKPGHPNWAETEKRIAEQWRKHYQDYLARTGRITSEVGYAWMDDALAREYARVFSADELGALLTFYRSPAGGALLTLEKEFLDFYPNELTRSLARVTFGFETLSAREQAAFRSPENQERREFAALFEIDTILVDEVARIGDKYVEGSFPAVPQGSLATAADPIDALRRKLDAALLTELHAFLKSALGRKERAFIGGALPTVTPVGEDPARIKAEDAAFYKSLQQLSAQWRELATRPTAK